MEQLKKLRKQRKVNQKTIAEILNVTTQAYSRYERGERELGYDSLRKLANYFNVSVDYLIGRTDNSTTEWTDDEKALGITDKARIEVNTRQYKWLELGDEVYDTKGEQYYNVICDMIKASIEHK